MSASKTLNTSEYHAYFQQYIDLVTETTIHAGLQASAEKLLDYYQQLPEEKHEYRYDTGKWTPKEILLHLIDAERVFCYRALWFSRMEGSKLEGFDHDAFVLTSDANARNMTSLLDEFKTTRESTIQLFKGFPAHTLLNEGKANGNPFSVRALGYLCCGHVLHHLKVLKSKY